MGNGPRRGQRRGFNPRPREGGDPRELSARPPIQRFNPRPREGGDALLPVQLRELPVSIHAPARGATPVHVRPAGSHQFQSTPPRGGRLGSHADRDHACRFQSTPPRGGRRLTVALNVLSFPVSIHAPARGATLVRLFGPLETRCFNPRPREGGDQKRDCL